MKNSNKKLIIITIIIALISITIGIVFKGGFLGTISLTIGFLNAYYMSQGKWYNYLMGITYGVFYTYICYIQGLYGAVIMNIVFFEPIQIMGLVNWINHRDENSVLTKSLTLKYGIIMLSLIVLASFSFGFILTLIPRQNIAFLDSTSQILNVCATVLLFLRFREAWQIWIIQSTIELIIWIICFINKGDYSFMMLLTSIMYLCMNIYGFKNWFKIERLQNLNS